MDAACFLNQGIKWSLMGLVSYRIYCRTLEGSACVFIASLVIVGAHHAHFSTPQFVAAMVVMPIAFRVALWLAVPVVAVALIVFLVALLGRLVLKAKK